MSTSSSTPPAGAAQKTRSPLERAVVWGVILVLLALVGVEYSARRNYDGALETLRSKMEAIDTQEGAAAVTEAVVKETLGGKSADSTENFKGKIAANGAKRVDVYSWFTLNPFVERRMLVYYGVGENPEVVSIDSKEVEFLPEYKPVEIREINDDERSEYAYTHDNYGQIKPGAKERWDAMSPEEKKANAYVVGGKKDAPTKNAPRRGGAKEDGAKKDDAPKTDADKSEENKDEK